MGRVERGTGAEGDRDRITSVLPGHGKAFGLVLSEVGSHSFRVGEGPEVKCVFKRWVSGRTDCREEGRSRGAVGRGPDAGSLGQRAPAGLMAGGLGMCPPTPSQQERVSGAPRLSSAEVDAGARAGTVVAETDAGHADGLEEEEGKGPRGPGHGAGPGSSRQVFPAPGLWGRDRPPCRRHHRSGRCQEPAADEQWWGRPLGLGRLLQRRSELPRGRPRGRRPPPTRSRAERTQTGCVPTAPPLGTPSHLRRFWAWQRSRPRAAAWGVLGDPHPPWSQPGQPVVWS